MDKWHLGTQIDTNSYRRHKCLIQENFGKNENNVKFPNRKGWIEFTCICGSFVKQSKKHYSPKEILRCNDCRNIC